MENPLSVYKVVKALNVGIPFNTLPYIGGAELNQLLTPHFKQIQLRVEVFKEITPKDMDNTLRPFNIELSPPLYELLRRRFYQCLAVK